MTADKTIESFALYQFSVPVRFRISGRTMAYSHHLLVRLACDDVEGWGAAPLYNRLALKTASDLRRIARPALTSLRAPTVALLRQKINRLLVSETNSVLSALDGALWEIEARTKGCPVAEVLGPIRRRSIPVTEQLFIEEEALEQSLLDAFLARGTQRIKMKIGDDPVRDVRAVERVRRRAGSDIDITVDANRAYSLHDALWVGPRLASLGVRIWEEPIATDSWEDLARLREDVPLSVMLDESILKPSDLDEAIAAGAIDILNAKLTRLGGLTQALAFAEKSRSARVRMSLGCAEDLGPAMMAILHLSAVIEDLEGTEGLGCARLGFDCATPSPLISAGQVALPDGPGWGTYVDLQGFSAVARERGFRVWDLSERTPARFLFNAARTVVAQRSQKWWSAPRRWA